MEGKTMTDLDRSETEFLLRRAEEEMIQGIRTNSASAGSVHRRLSMLYSARAVTTLAGGDGPVQPSGSVRS